MRFVALALLVTASPESPPVESAAPPAPPERVEPAPAEVVAPAPAEVVEPAPAEVVEPATPRLDVGSLTVAPEPEPSADETAAAIEDEEIIVLPDNDEGIESAPTPETEPVDALPPMPIEEPPAAPPAPVSERPLVVVKTLVGLLLLIVLAYLGGHPRVRSLEAKLGISRIVAAGFPFLALGFVAATEPIGVLSPSVIDHLRPLLHLALGWLGLVVGMRVELGRMNSLPRGAPAILAIGTGLPFVMIAAGGGVLLLADRALRGEPLVDTALVRDALVLGTAGAMAADTDALQAALRRLGDVARDRLSQIARLDETVGLVGLIFLTAYLRPDSSWNVPGTAWLFITLGLPACAGFVVYLGLRLRTSSTELVALLLGFVAFVAGLASTLRLSALVVCFVIGVLLANFPGEYHQRLRTVLGRLEAPIYLMFLLVAGARWQPGAVIGWALVLVLLLARLPGRWLGVRLAWSRTEIDLPRDARPALVFSPLGTLPIAIAVNAELLYPDDATLSAIITAVIGATIALEFFAQLYWRSSPQPSQAPGGQP